MALIAPQSIPITGKKPTYAAASGGGDTVNPNDRTFLHYKNGSGGSITVTVVVPGTRFGQALPDVAVAIPAGEEKMIGPMSRDLRGTNGLIAVTYSGVTSLTVAALRI